MYFSMQMKYTSVKSLKNITSKEIKYIFINRNQEGIEIYVFKYFDKVERYIIRFMNNRVNN